MSDLAWFDQMLAHPPSCLSELERLVGNLDVDFAGGEGDGHVTRDPGALRPGITGVWARFDYDLYHQVPTQPRDMALDNVMIRIDASRAALEAMLEAHHGAGRAVTGPNGPMLEYGAWCYLDVGADRPARVAWHRRRPEWALPQLAPTTREDFLATLVDRLVCEAAEPAIVAALAPLAVAAGAEITSPMRVRRGGVHDGILMAFRPGLPLAAVASAFRWERPVAQSGDVHMSSWSVMPLAAAEAPPWRPRLGRWLIQAALDRWPRGPGNAELPQLGRAGPSPLYDVRDCANTIVAISIVPADP